MPDATREHLLHLLAEAAELEHNLLCSYLFALFSLKTGPGEGLHDGEREAVARWRRSLLAVCVEEMVHLAQVANLTTALGAQPHFNRPNLPVPAGYHPAAIVVRLTRFDLETLQHFIHLERPDDSHEPDGAHFVPPSTGRRRRHPGGLVPTAPDYATLGEFYGVIRRGLADAASRLGEAALFCGPAGVQLRPQEANAPALRVVTGLASACEAIDAIVAQGEGAPGEVADSHYARFLAMRSEYRALLAHRPGFEPSRAVGADPVLRPPLTPGHTHVDHPETARVLDTANALYAFMLRGLAACYQAEAGGSGRRADLVAAAFGAMHALEGLGTALTRLPASEARPGVMAGLSFLVPRATEVLAPGADAARLLAERLAEIQAGVRGLRLPPRCL